MDLKEMVKIIRASNIPKLEAEIIAGKLIQDYNKIKNLERTYKSNDI